MAKWAWVPKTCQFEVRDAGGQLLESATLEFVIEMKCAGNNRQRDLAYELLALKAKKRVV